MTVCYNCKHVQHVVSNPNAPEVWYNYFCAAVEREATVDPISGRACYKDTNDLGTEYTTDNKYKYCKDINKGNCPLFELKLLH